MKPFKKPITYFNINLYYKNSKNIFQNSYLKKKLENQSRIPSNSLQKKCDKVSYKNIVCQCLKLSLFVNSQQETKFIEIII